MSTWRDAESKSRLPVEAHTWARILALVAALVAGSALGTTVITYGAGESSVKLVAKEFLFAPNKLSTTSGATTFVVTNQGSIEHNFVVEDDAKKKVAEIAIIAPGETAQVSATLQTGTYAILCTLPGHKEAGMTASLHVPR